MIYVSFVSIHHFRRTMCAKAVHLEFDSEVKFQMKKTQRWLLDREDMKIYSALT